MTKRYLSPAYRAGVETFVSKMREWQADPEHNYPHQTAAKMREAVTSLDGASGPGLRNLCPCFSTCMRSRDAGRASKAGTRSQSWRIRTTGLLNSKLRRNMPHQFGTA